MWFYISVPLLACLNIVVSRDVGKTMAVKTLPHVSNSLVNLGKMDISFHFNTHPEDFAPRSELRNHGPSSFFSPKLDSVREEPCPCSSFTYLKDSYQNHPSELLNKILSGNDLFSFKGPNSSPLCCDSHENVHEDILLEFGPKLSQMVIKPETSNSNPLSILPLLLNSLKHRPILPTVPAKPKAVEIVFFPKKGGLLPMDFEKVTTKKKEGKIQIVGDKEIRNDFKTMNLAPPLSSSVKKDLALQEKNKSVTKNKIEKIIAMDAHNTVA